MSAIIGSGRSGLVRAAQSWVVISSTLAPSAHLEGWQEDIVGQLEITRADVARILHKTYEE